MVSDDSNTMPIITRKRYFVVILRKEVGEAVGGLETGGGGFGGGEERLDRRRWESGYISNCGKTHSDAFF